MKLKRQIMMAQKKFKTAVCSVCLFILTVFSQNVAQANASALYLLSSPGYNPGLFCVFASVLGSLDFYEKTPGIGLKVDFGDKGWYYDQKHGPNWWDYYFEPIKLGNQSATPIIEIPDNNKSFFAMDVLNNMSRERAHELIQKYIKPKRAVVKKVNYYLKKYFKNQYVIGVHYRGTDKSVEAPRVSYDDVALHISQAIEKLSTDNYKIFVATDEIGFLDYVSKKFKNRIIVIEAMRTNGSVGVHNMMSGNNYEKGKEAVIDCILLSKCHLLIKSASNLSNISMKFNPQLPVIHLNKHFYETQK